MCKELKKCSKCQEYKLKSSFCKDSSRHDNLSRQCKDCKKQLTKQWREINHKHRSDYQKEYRDKNRSVVNKHAAVWKKNNPIWVKNYKRNRKRRDCVEVSDGYISKLLNKPLNTLRLQPEVIETKRLLIQIKREIK